MVAQAFTLAWYGFSYGFHYLQKWKFSTPITRVSWYGFSAMTFSRLEYDRTGLLLTFHYIHMPLGERASLFNERYATRQARKWSRWCASLRLTMLEIIISLEHSLFTYTYFHENFRLYLQQFIMPPSMAKYLIIVKMMLWQRDFSAYQVIKNFVVEDEPVGAIEWYASAYLESLPLMASGSRRLGQIYDIFLGVIADYVIHAARSRYATTRFHLLMRSFPQYSSQFVSRYRRYSHLSLCRSIALSLKIYIYRAFWHNTIFMIWANVIWYRLAAEASHINIASLHFTGL